MSLHPKLYTYLVHTQEELLAAYRERDLLTRCLGTPRFFPLLSCLLHFLVMFLPSKHSLTHDSWSHELHVLLTEAADTSNFLLGLTLQHALGFASAFSNDSVKESHSILVL